MYNSKIFLAFFASFSFFFYLFCCMAISLPLASLCYDAYAQYSVRWLFDIGGKFHLSSAAESVLAIGVLHYRLRRCCGAFVSRTHVKRVSFITKYNSRNSLVMSTRIEYTHTHTQKEILKCEFNAIINLISSTLSLSFLQCQAKIAKKHRKKKPVRD